MHSDQRAVDTLRAHLSGDFAAAAEGYGRLTGDGATEAWVLYAAHVSATFILAAGRHFGQTYDRGQVVRYVADIRLRSQENAELDPQLAEVLFLNALGDGDAIEGDPLARLRTEMVLLESMVRDAQLRDAEILDLVQDASARVPHWFPGAESE